LIRYLYQVYPFIGPIEQEHSVLSTVDDIAQRVKKVIADYLDVPVEAVKEDSSFTDDLDMDSLAVMELVIALEEEFSISVDDRSAETIKSVGDAIRVLQKVVSQQPG
jgi:acyl carrier protein